MVPFREEAAAMSEYQSDAMALAGAFQAASDEDIRLTMNAMSAGASRSSTSWSAAASAGTQSSSSLPSQPTSSGLQYFIVPATWFLKAFPILSARSPDGISIGHNWKENIGRIANSELVRATAEENLIYNDDATGNNTNEKHRLHQSQNTSTDQSNTGEVSDIQKKRFDQMHRRMGLADNHQELTMKPGLVHKRDYFFLGPSTWTLVKEKFDFDGYELARSVVYNSASSSLAIQLQERECQGTSGIDNNATNIPALSSRIEIPATARFPYEEIFTNSKSTGMQVTAGTTGEQSTIVPMFEDNQWEHITHDDGNKSEEDSPILLLPSSTSNALKDDRSMEVDNPTSIEDTSNLNNEIINSNDGIPNDEDPPVFTGRKRHATGLANLGNTCFMNSSLQCLAHTDPLRSYFLSGEYAKDLNKDNPLGTGGELAVSFATLIRDMWGVAAKRRNVMGASSSATYSDSSSGAVYPRSFKYCLGKHAEQFVGYDQHDSQEVATYLLDALHEDTNRVTKKPYVEIPEQGEEESDDTAAAKAWELHKRRENSRVLENFMGQVKSRLECCRDGCNRVSTTYDPFMYLSVPIPGSNDRSLDVTFVPLDPEQRMRTMSLTVNKTALISGVMTKMNEELVKHGVIESAIPLEDLIAADIFNFDIFSWLEHTGEVDRIRETDKTFIFQLRTLSEVQKDSSQAVSKDIMPEDVFGAPRQNTFSLGIEELSRLNQDDMWQIELEKYVQSKMLLLNLFNPNRGSNDELVKFYKKLTTFIDLCLKEIELEETSGTKRSRERPVSVNTINENVSKMDERVQGLDDRSDASISFKGVRTRTDVATLEFCAQKLRVYTTEKMNSKKVSHADGILIQVIMRRHKFGSSYETFVQPVVLRIPANMTVYAFRHLLALRLSRCIKSPGSQRQESGEPLTESFMSAPFDSTFGSPELMAVRQIPLSYEQKSSYRARSNSSYGTNLGMVRPKDETDNEGSISMALAANEAEQVLLADVVGPNGAIYVNWTEELCDRFFDSEEFNFQVSLDEPRVSDEGEKKTLTVMDCIEKYCQKEQLEESEMWYCNSCKDHVRAWKQFHIYRAPPILIVHLKRFHYSASTHRRNKITSLIDFPLEGLDLTHLVSFYEEGKEPVYNCYAVSNHYGNLGGGHYTAYVLDDDGTWLHYDDSRVTNIVEPTDVITEASYVLYFRRRDVETGQDPILPEQTSPVHLEINEIPQIPVEDRGNDAVEEDDDNMAVDGNGSSRTSSPISDIGSISGDEYIENSNAVSFVPGSAGNDSDFPPLQ